MISIVLIIAFQCNFSIMKFAALILGLVAGLAVAHGAVEGDSCTTNKGTCPLKFSYDFLERF